MCPLSCLAGISEAPNLSWGRRMMAQSSLARGLFFLGASVVATALAGATVRASQATAPRTVADLAVSATPGGPPAVTFRGRPTTLWVRFSYQGTTAATVRISLVSPAGLVLFRRGADLAGPGRHEWALEGSAVARHVATGAQDAAAAARDNARRAATRTRGVAGYLSAAAYATDQARSGLDVLATVGLSGAARQHRREAWAAAIHIRDLLDQASALPPEDVAGRRALAEAMAAPAAEAVASVGRLVEDLEGASDLRLPPTRSAAGEGDAHTVAARVDGTIARSLEVWVFDGRAFLPWAARDANGRGPW